jgi:hypothetical protein
MKYTDIDRAINGFRGLGDEIRGDDLISVAVVGSAIHRDVKAPVTDVDVLIVLETVTPMLYRAVLRHAASVARATMCGRKLRVSYSALNAPIKPRFSGSDELFLHLLLYGRREYLRRPPSITGMYEAENRLLCGSPLRSLRRTSPQEIISSMLSGPRELRYVVRQLEHRELYGAGWQRRGDRMALVPFTRRCTRHELFNLSLFAVCITSKTYLWAARGRLRAADFGQQFPDFANTPTLLSFLASKQDYASGRLPLTTPLLEETRRESVRYVRSLYDYIRVRSGCRTRQ